MLPFKNNFVTSNVFAVGAIQTKTKADKCSLDDYKFYCKNYAPAIGVLSGLLLVSLIVAW